MVTVMGNYRMRSGLNTVRSCLLGFGLMKSGSVILTFESQLVPVNSAASVTGLIENE